MPELRQTSVFSPTTRILIASGILLLAAVLRLAPRPPAQVLACHFAPSPLVCDLTLAPLVGAENVANQDTGPAQPPPALDRSAPLPPCREWCCLRLYFAAVLP